MKIIYSKKYPPEDDNDDNGELIPPEEILTAFLDARSRLSFQYLAERKEGRMAFIRKAVKFSQDNKYDIEITETSYFIEAELSFDDQYNLGTFTRLIGMADDITIYTGINERLFTVSLLYYTHAVFLDGKQVIPLPPEA